MAQRTSDARVRRTQVERSETTRAGVVAAAVEIIVRDGTADVRLNDVACLAGVTKGALQHHFSSKANLLAAVSEAGWTDFIDRMERIGPLEGPIDDRVDLLVETMWESYSGAAFHAAFMIASTAFNDPELRARHEQVYRTARGILESAWAGAFADTGLGLAELRRARRFARTHLIGLLSHRRIDPDAPPIGPQLDTLKAALTQMLSSHNPPDACEQGNPAS